MVDNDIAIYLFVKSAVVNLPIWFIVSNSDCQYNILPDSIIIYSASIMEWSQLPVSLIDVISKSYSVF